MRFTGHLYLAHSSHASGCVAAVRRSRPAIVAPPAEVESRFAVNAPHNSFIVYSKFENLECEVRTVTLKPQDLAVVLEYVLTDGEYPTYESVARALHMTPSNVFASAKRAVNARLLQQQDRRVLRPIRSGIEEFIVHGARYAFYPERGSPTRGTLTAHAAPPLNRDIATDPSPPVWPDPEGAAFGPALKPLWPNAGPAARADPRLHELLALTDALRGGRARERKLAQEFLHRRLNGDWT